MVHMVEPHTYVRLKAATARYGRGKPVFSGVDLSIEEPGLYQIRGPNGSGKSTLVEVLSGYLPVINGEVLVNGVPADSMEAHERRRICRAEPALYPMMSVRDHLLFASRWTEEDPARALDRSQRYGLGPWLDAAAETLSTGNRRRLWIIQCTLGNFDVLVMDEPFNGLDDASRTVLIEELEGWSHKCSVLLIAHQPPPGLPVDRVIPWEPAVSPNV